MYILMLNVVVMLFSKKTGISEHISNVESINILSICGLSSVFNISKHDTSSQYRVSRTSTTVWHRLTIGARKARITQRSVCDVTGGGRF